MSIQNICLNSIKELATIKELYDYSDFEEDINRFQDRLLDKEFRIAVVGEFSSGKSTFINAMLGKDILNHATTETTAVITRIVNVPADDARVNTGLVRFHNGKTIVLDNFSDIKEYTTTLSTKFKVVEEVDCVDIYVPTINGSADIVIVDTPGLNGMADGHREITVDIIKRAHACIYLLQKRGLTETDITFLKFLLNYQRNFIFVQNFIDEFRVEEGETVDGKLEEQKKLLQENVFSEHEGAFFSICGISALLKLVSVDLDIPRLYSNSKHDLTDEERLTLAQRSNFITFTSIMEEQFKEDKLADLQYGDVAWAFKNWLHDLLDYVEREHSHAEEALEESKDYNSIQRLELLKNKIRDNIPRHKANLQSYIVDKLRDIRKKKSSSINHSLNEINNMHFINLQCCSSMREFDKINKNLPEEINNSITQLISKTNGEIEKSVGILHQVILAQVSEYSGIKCEDIVLPQMEEFFEGNKPIFSVDDSRAKALEQKLVIAKEDEVTADIEQVRLNNEIKDANKEVSNYQRQLTQAENKKQSDLNALGSRPAKRVYEESYTYYRDRTGFGSFFTNMIFGQKKCTGYRTVQDDSAGIAWDEKKSSIINTAVALIAKIDANKAAAERQVARLQIQKNDGDAQLERARNRVKGLEEQLALQRETDKLALEKAEREYLQMRISKLKQHIQNYIEDVAKEQLQANLEDDIKKIQEGISAWTMTRYDEAVEQKLKWIEQCKLEKAPELRMRIKNLNDVVEKIKDILKTMEV